MSKERRVGSANLAVASLALGDAENALRWFQQAIDDKALEDRIPLMELKGNIWLDSLLDTSEFQQLRAKVGAL